MFNTKIVLGASICLGLAWGTTSLAEPTHRTEFLKKNLEPSLLSQEANATLSATPFQANNGAIPTKKEFEGKLFELNSCWPTAPLPAPKDGFAWQKAIGNKPITTQNAHLYAAALKEHVSKNARALIVGHDTWNAKSADWYNEPWLGSQREAISGTYAAGTFGPGIFPGTGLKTEFQTHVLTYYDARAAYTLSRVWGKYAVNPTITEDSGQFEEGAIVVKAALFASTDPKMPTNWWDAMTGAAEWPLFISLDKAPPSVRPAYVAQFDIIVKDTQSSPETGWVFMTVVYDKAAKGDAWDKMVPLGAMWGQDPQATKEGDVLTENWINPKAPLYSTQTLGWGGRLSGPNDGARNDIAYDGKSYKNAGDSSCMSCHSTAQWNLKTNSMPSFLLPSYAAAGNPPFQMCDTNGKPDVNGDYICSPTPASKEWMKWFTNRKGNEPMDAGSIAMDFSEVFSFKSLPLWYAATKGEMKEPNARIIEEHKAMCKM